jgi:HSP20 family protein
MASITRFDPLNDLVDDLFKGFFVRPMVYEGASAAGALPRMKVDVLENDGGYLVSAELPGVRKDDIQVTVDSAQVTLSAEVKREREVGDGERVLHAERSFGRVQRSFTLPQEIDQAKAEAKFRDGVLELTLPKKAAAARKQIAIS